MYMCNNMLVTHHCKLPPYTINTHRHMYPFQTTKDDDGEPIEVPAEALRDAIAQLVYTATGLPEDDAVRSVRIRIDGQAATLPTEGGDSEEVLDRSDFETYDPDFVPPVATAPPTTTTPDPDAGDADS